jgi:hypothetical protein
VTGTRTAALLRLCGLFLDASGLFNIHRIFLLVAAFNIQGIDAAVNVVTVVVAIDPIVDDAVARTSTSRLVSLVICPILGVCFAFPAVLLKACI